MGGKRSATAMARKERARALGKKKHSTGNHKGQYKGFADSTLCLPKGSRRPKLAVERFKVDDNTHFIRERDRIISGSSRSSPRLASPQAEPFNDSERQKWKIVLKYCKLLLMGTSKGAAEQIVCEEEEISESTLHRLRRQVERTGSLA